MTAPSVGNEISTVQLIIWIIPNVLWVCFATALLVTFYRPLRYDVLPYLRGLKFAGVECLFVQEGIRAAVALAQKHPGWKVQVTSEQARLAMDRASRHQELLKGTRILWVDDVPENNRNEIKMLHQLQADIDTATSTGEALEKISSQSYELVVSDMKRGDDVEAGVIMLEQFQRQKIECPVIFYVGDLDPGKGTPVHAFGLTNRPDELVHLVLDILERTKSTVPFRGKGGGFA
jgi:CheY-like chemotaxis protein